MHAADERYLPDWMWERAREHVPPTFIRRQRPRPDHIDARRDDGCVPLITSVRVPKPHVSGNDA